MTADEQLLADASAAEERHRLARCKCGTKVRLSGSDGPSIRLFEAAWRLAQAVDADYGPDAGPATVQAVLVALERYRKANLP